MRFEFERDEAIALEAEAKLTLDGIDKLPNPSAEALRTQERLTRAYRKLKAEIDKHEEAWANAG